mmetsp:Transcript_23384/g.75663  ORF Transcript_23384/g.75663 Transcript_23384/m.75663 type:complete len:80 (-) Transcript_23384:375-614(-)
MALAPQAVIVLSGFEADLFYMVAQGEFEVLQQGVQVCTLLNAGQSFGETRCSSGSLAARRFVRRRRPNSGPSTARSSRN